MAKRSPILGYNHNFRHRGLVFHVQTEDSGVRNPHIFTHLFHGGVIVSSRKLTYDSGASADVIKALMQAQHRAMLKDLKRGAFDEKITDYFGDEPELKPSVMTDHLATDPAAVLEEDPTDPGQTTLEAVQAVEAAAEVIEALNNRPELFEDDLFLAGDPDSVTVPRQDTIKMEAVQIEAVERAVVAAKVDADRAAPRSVSGEIDENAQTLPPLDGPATASFEDDIPTKSFQDEIVTLPPLASEPATLPAELFDAGTLDDDEIVTLPPASPSPAPLSDDAITLPPIARAASPEVDDDAVTLPPPLSRAERARALRSHETIPLPVAVNARRRKEESGPAFIHATAPEAAADPPGARPMTPGSYAKFRPRRQTGEGSRTQPVATIPMAARPAEGKPAGKRRHVSNSDVIVSRPSVIVGSPSELIAETTNELPTRRAREASSLFGKDLISEKSLDEVILAYLSEDGSQDGG